MSAKPNADPAVWIEDVIRDFIERSPENTLQDPFQEKGFENPLVGFSNGADDIFESYKQYVFASTWSERHMAYAAGLGTFGLCDGLITSRGKAMRTGSVVAHIKINATPRPYDDHQAYQPPNPLWELFNNFLIMAISSLASLNAV